MQACTWVLGTHGYYWVLRGTRIVCELCCNAGAGAAELIAAELTPGTVPGSSATADKPTIEAAARASTAKAELLAMLDLEVDLEEPEAGAGSGSGSATGKPKDKPKGNPKAQRGKRTTVSSEPRFITFTFAWLSAVLFVLAVAGFWCLHWCLGLLGRVAPRELLAAAWLFGYLSRLPQDIAFSFRRVSLCLSCAYDGALAGYVAKTGPCCWGSCSCSRSAASISSLSWATAPP